jgi:hypothetical protein
MASTFFLAARRRARYRTVEQKALVGRQEHRFELSCPGVGVGD